MISYNAVHEMRAPQRFDEALLFRLSKAPDYLPLNRSTGKLMKVDPIVRWEAARKKGEG